MYKGKRRREVIKIVVLVGSATCGVIGIGIDGSQNIWMFAEKLFIAIAAVLLLTSVSPLKFLSSDKYPRIKRGNNSCARSRMRAQKSGQRKKIGKKPKKSRKGRKQRKK